MNNQKGRNLLKILVSFMTIGLFIVLYMGSLNSQQAEYFYVTGYEKIYDESTGLYKLEENLGFGRKRTTWGNTNKGQWHGAVRIRIDESGGDSVIIETNMFNGKRHGISITTLPDGTEITLCYVMGHPIDCSYFSLKKQNIDDESAYQYFSDRYPWLLIQYNALGFNNDYIEAFLDTVETIIGANPIDVSLIEDYYDDAVEILENTPYDSIIRVNTACAYLMSIEDLKNYELRRAVVDHYKEGIPTFQIIQTKYSNYPEPLYDEGGSEADFEQFCNDLDDTLALFGPLDQEDPFFYDSIDSWLNWSILSIYEAGESELSIGNQYITIPGRNVISGIRYGMQHIQPFSDKISSPEIAEMVLYQVLMTWLEDDLFRKSVMSVYLTDNGEYLVPTVATVLLENSTLTSAVFEGHVFEDGGSEVTSRGIAWATIYNPDIEDNTEDGGTGTGSFEASISGLTEGTTYYARAYATNEAGTAYGNCISFIPSAAGVEIQNNHKSLPEFMLYPGPASTFVTFCFQSENPEEVTVDIINMNGQIVLEHKPDESIQGNQEIKVDISHLREGLYIGLLKVNGRPVAAQKLIIVH